MGDLARALGRIIERLEQHNRGTALPNVQQPAPPALSSAARPFTTVHDFQLRSPPTGPPVGMSAAGDVTAKGIVLTAGLLLAERILENLLDVEFSRAEHGTRSLGPRARNRPTATADRPLLAAFPPRRTGSHLPNAQAPPPDPDVVLPHPNSA